MSEEAKAVQEVAKLAKQSLETAERIGGWTGTVFGEGLQHVGGAFADSMAGFRLRNRVRVLEKTHAAIAKAGMLSQMRPLSDRMALPIFEAISEEPDETIQDVWAAYLKSAVDPSKPLPDRTLIDVIRRLEPIDWPIIQRLFAVGEVKVSVDDLEVDDHTAEVVMDRLTVLGLFSYDDEKSAYLVMGGHMEGVLSIHVPPGTYYANKLFYQFRAATGNA